MKLKVNDIVNMEDGSYCFGIREGEFVTDCSNGYSRRPDERQKLRVVTVGINEVAVKSGIRDKQYDEIPDILVTNDKGDFWFTQSCFVKLVSHSIEIDGKRIELSEQSFENLKKQLLG